MEGLWFVFGCYFFGSYISFKFIYYLGEVFGLGEWLEILKGWIYGF